MRGFGLQRQRPVADQLRIAAVLLRKIGRWMPQYAVEKAHPSAFCGKWQKSLPSC